MQALTGSLSVHRARVVDAAFDALLATTGSSTSKDAVPIGQLLQQLRPARHPAVQVLANGSPTLLQRACYSASYRSTLVSHQGSQCAVVCVYRRYCLLCLLSSICECVCLHYCSSACCWIGAQPNYATHTDTTGTAALYATLPSRLGSAQQQK
jgi:hypothetical protein